MPAWRHEATRRLLAEWQCGSRVAGGFADPAIIAGSTLMSTAPQPDTTQSGVLSISIVLKLNLS